MSYILDALKKSESERQQGRVPDLGQQIRMIHRGRKRGIPAAAWLTLALVINAVVLMILFWPERGLWVDESADAAPSAVTGPPPLPASAGNDPVLVAPQPPGSGAIPESDELVIDPASASGELSAGNVSGNETPIAVDAPADGIIPPPFEAPTVITPTIRPTILPGVAMTDEPYPGRVPHLVEMPMAFQRQVPDLVFNSHVYSSDVANRRVMINNRVLRTGETFGSLRVERITEDGVELSMDGERFRVGVVRDWSAPR